MPPCEMLKLSRNKATCDPSGLWGCPKAKGRDMITPECWRLRRFYKKAKESVPEKQVKCPRCRFTFPVKKGEV